MEIRYSLLNIYFEPWVDQFTYYTRCKFPQNFKDVSICAVDKTLVRMFSGKTMYEKETTLSNYHLPVEGCSGNQEQQVDNILVRGDSTLVFY